MTTTKRKVLIAMSGGVDSSVAAKLLLAQGNDCVGATMLLHQSDARGRDVDDARTVAEKLGIPHYVFDYRTAFSEDVVASFVNAYLSGYTPNPCVVCNQKFKFTSLLAQATQLGCEMMATGHYARIVKMGDRYKLCKALDPKKDQSYFLYTLTQAQLARIIFPLGELSKEQIRAMAVADHLCNAQKPDSQDICFVPDGDYAQVIKQHANVSDCPGNIVDCHGKVLGQHQGFWHYTRGQRKGLGLALSQPVYVCGTNAQCNEVVVGPNENLWQKTCLAHDFNWIAGETPKFPLRCQAKIRSTHQAQMATVNLLGADVQVVFDTPQRAITLGQAVVLYHDDEVLGGGTIFQI